MWLLYVFLHVFLLATVNYIDEYLTGNNKVPQSSNIHTKIGGLLLVSTLLGCIGATAIFLIAGDVSLPQTPLLLALLSAIPMVIIFAAYFYLLTLYPVYLVIPLFLISSFWLLALELLTGGTITLLGLLGIASLLVDAYFLDAGTVKWQIPTKLLLISLPVTLSWAIALFMVRLAAESASPLIISFWQLVGLCTIGVLLFVLVRPYREGFIFRIKNQGKNFLGMSLVNESLGQGSYAAGNFAVATAPVATYVTAMTGVQSLILLGLFVLFPLKKEPVQINTLQVVSIILIALGVFLIERSY